MVTSRISSSLRSVEVVKWLLESDPTFAEHSLALESLGNRFCRDTAKCPASRKDYLYIKAASSIATAKH